MKAKRMILSGLVILLTMILAGCPPKLPAADKITAKEAWGIIEPAKETLSDDAVLVYIEGISMRPEYPAVEGKSPRWDTGFYSESERAVWVIGYYAESDSEATPTPGEERYSDVSLTPYDLADWKIDSPEACDIAAQNGAEGTNFMRLQAADLETMDNAPVFVTPEFIPESTKLFWVIRDDHYDMYYIDAYTGEYLGCIKYRAEDEDT